MGSGFTELIQMYLATRKPKSPRMPKIQQPEPLPNQTSEEAMMAAESLARRRRGASSTLLSGEGGQMNVGKKRLLGG